MSILNMPEIKIYTPFGSLISQPRKFSSVQFSRSVMSDSLRPHGLQHTRLNCPSPTPRVHSNSCPWSWWCHLTNSSSVIPFSSCFQAFPASGSFPVSQFFTSGGQSIEVSDSASSFQWIFRTYFLLDRLVGSPCSPRDSQDSSATPQFKASFLQCAAFYIVHLSHPYMLLLLLLSRFSHVQLCATP